MSIYKITSRILLTVLIMFFMFVKCSYTADFRKYDPATEKDLDKKTISEDISKFKNIIDATTYMHNFCLDSRFKAAIYTADLITNRFKDKIYSYNSYWSLLGWSYMMTGDVEKAIDAYKIHFKVTYYPNGIQKDKVNSDDYKMKEWVHVIKKFKEKLPDRKVLLKDLYKYSLEFNEKYPNAPEEYSEIPNGIIKIYEESQNEKNDYEINKALVEDFFHKLALIIKNKDKSKLKEFLDNNSINKETSSEYYDIFIEYYFEWDIKSLEFEVTDFDYSKEKYNRFGHSRAIYEIKSEPDIDKKIRERLNDRKGKWSLRFCFINKKALLFS